MTLKELYEQRLKEYNDYKEKKIAYDTRLEELIKRAKSIESNVYERLEDLEPETMARVCAIIPEKETITEDNIIQRREQWRNVYTELEKYGYELLGQE